MSGVRGAMLRAKRLAKLGPVDFQVLERLEDNGRAWASVADAAAGPKRLARPGQQLMKLYDLGLVERINQGATKPAYQYRISAAGRKVLAQERADS
jgi:hypothetical protein